MKGVVIARPTQTLLVYYQSVTGLYLMGQMPISIRVSIWHDADASVPRKFPTTMLIAYEEDPLSHIQQDESQPQAAHATAKLIENYSVSIHASTNSI